MQQKREWCVRVCCVLEIGGDLRGKGREGGRKGGKEVDRREIEGKERRMGEEV